MSKNNKTVKHGNNKFDLNFLIIFILIHMFILFVFLSLDERDPLKKHNCKEK
jgi:hypothetical protein